jgi:hypothetical protein
MRQATTTSHQGTYRGDAGKRARLSNHMPSLRGNAHDSGRLKVLPCGFGEGYGIPSEFATLGDNSQCEAPIVEEHLYI